MTNPNHFLFRLINEVRTGPALDPCMIFLDRINDYERSGRLGDRVSCLGGITDLYMGI